MDSFVDPNLKVVFDGVELVKGVGKTSGKPYTAMDVRLRLVSQDAADNNTVFSHRVFAPSEDKASKYRVNGFIKNMVEQLGGELPPSGFIFDTFEDYVKHVIHELERFKGVQIYVKMLKNKQGYLRLGYTLPVFSNSPHMDWSDYERELISTTEGVVKDESPLKE